MRVEVGAQVGAGLTHHVLRHLQPTSTTLHESQMLAFNYVSLTLNNSFFLHRLVSPLRLSTKTKNSASTTPYSESVTVNSKIVKP